MFGCEFGCEFGCVFSISLDVYFAIKKNGIDMAGIHDFSCKIEKTGR